MIKRLMLTAAVCCCGWPWLGGGMIWAEGPRLAGPALRAVDELRMPAMAGEAYGLDDLTEGRSLRQPGHHPEDELDRPRMTRRQSHRGWEVRTFHTVVTSATSTEQAEWMAAEMEDVWSELSHLADGFSGVHRQPTFGLGAVSVSLTEDDINERADVGSGPALLNDGVQWVAKVGHGPDAAMAAAYRLRREAGQAFLRVAQWDQRLPAWVQEGLVGFAAGPVPEAVATTHSAAPTEQGVAAPGTAAMPWTAARVAADVVQASAVRSSCNMQAADGWMRYLLTAEDGRFAPAVLATVATAVNASSPAESAAGFSPDRLTGNLDVEQRYSDWQRNPQMHQPVVRLSSADDRELAALANTMTIVLKLARRFGEERGETWLTLPTAAVQPKVIEFGRAGAQEVSMPAANAAADIDLAAVAARMGGSGQAPWATLEGDGRLLLWYDRSRMASLFDGSALQWRSETRDGQPVVMVEMRDGRRAEARWDEPPKSKSRETIAARPTVYVQWLR